MEIQITVFDVIFPRESETEGRQWYKLAGSAANGERVICTGCLEFRPAERSKLNLTGDWSVYQGQRQFKFTDALPVIPADSRFLLSYVADRSRGIGPVTEEAIWAKKGEQWPELSEEEAGELKISKRVFAGFQAQIRQANEERLHCDTIVYLRKRGCTNKLAEAAWQKWGAESVGVIDSNCYRLTELAGFGFASVDGEIRRSYGIEDDDPRRIGAAIFYAMQQLTDCGSSAVPADCLTEKMQAVKIGISAAQPVFEQMFADGQLCGFPARQMVALGSHFEAEKTILGFVENGI